MRCIMHWWTIGGRARLLQKLSLIYIIVRDDNKHEASAAYYIELLVIPARKVSMLGLLIERGEKIVQSYCVGRNENV